jgi:hypothetical protein
MLVAHNRGLLSPGYAYGQVSRGAELMVLRALSAELQAQSLVEQSQSMLITLPAMSAANRAECVEKALEYQSRASRLRRLILQADTKPKHSNVIDSMVELFYALEKAGIIRNDDGN